MPTSVPQPPRLQSPKPQPSLPFWNCAPTPEQMPHGRAQHPEAQSDASRHCPPMNCSPAPLPAFGTPAGSNSGPGRPFAWQPSAGGGSGSSSPPPPSSSSLSSGGGSSPPPPPPPPPPTQCPIASHSDAACFG